MSIDFNSPIPNSAHSGYGQAELDRAFTSLHNGGSSPSQHIVGETIQSHEFDHPEGLGVPEQPAFDIFSTSSGNSFASPRYRTNASSSSSLGPAYNMNGESTYSHPSFTDNVPSFGASNGNTYDMMGMPSSYSSGKVSPLTPSDTVGPLPPVSTFPSSVGINKEYSHPSYHEIVPDRRMPGITTNGYQPDYQEEYPVSNGLPFPSSTLHHFQDRIGRFQQDDRYSHSSGPQSNVPSHSHPAHSHDLLRGVPPLATHAFRPDVGLHGYDDMHYMGQTHPEMPLRMPSVDETLARMKLQGHPIMGSSSDLQTFIRFIQAHSTLNESTPCLTLLSLDHT